VYGLSNDETLYRKLAQEGRYVPKDYLVAWDRRSLIEWARQAA